MSDDGFSPYLIDGATLSISADRGCFVNSLYNQLKVLLAIDYNVKITKEHLDQFNRHRHEGNDAIRNAGFWINVGPPIHNHNGDKTGYSDDIQLRNQTLVRKSIGKKKTRHGRLDNLQRTDNIPHHISIKTNC